MHVMCSYPRNLVILWKYEFCSHQFYFSRSSSQAASNKKVMRDAWSQQQPHGHIHRWSWEMHIYLTTVAFCVIWEYLGVLDAWEMLSLTKDGPKSPAPSLLINFQCPSFALTKYLAWVIIPSLNTEQTKPYVSREGKQGGLCRCSNKGFQPPRSAGDREGAIRDLWQGFGESSPSCGGAGQALCRWLR